MVIHEVDGRVVVDGVAGKTISNGDALQVDRRNGGHLSRQSGNVNSGVTLACISFQR